MAKKKSQAAQKVTGELKKLVDEYKDKLFLLAAGFFENKAKEIVGWLKDIGHLKRKIRTLILCLGLIMAGLFLVVFGIADYVIYRFPVLANGWGKILIGVIAVLVGYLIKKMS